MSSGLEKTTKAIISVDEYRSLVDDFVSSDDKIIKRISYLESFYRNIIRIEISTYVNQIKNMSKARKIKLVNQTDNIYEDREGLVYARVSSKRQETEGSGLETQESRCIADLKTIKVPHAKTFKDSFTGGGDFMKRPAMREMIEYIDKYPHKKFVVIFDDLKRFARDVEFHIKLRATLESREVVLKCLNYNFDESPEGRFAELIMAGHAELERKQNGRQVIQKQRARLELGYWAFGSKRGYKMTREHPVYGTISLRNEPDASHLQKALEGYAKGLYVRKVDACRFLVEQGFWGTQKPERYIDKFAQILKDPFYAGFIEYPAWEVTRRDGKHEGIISPEIFELNQKRLNKEDFGRKIRVDISPDFPMRGLVVCASCDMRLTAAWSKGRTQRYAYYKCQNRACEVYGKSIRGEDVEGNFNELLKNHKLNARAGPLIEKVFDKVWEEEVELFKKQQTEKSKTVGDIDVKIKQLTDMILATKVRSVIDAYEKQIEDLSKEKELEDPDLLKIVNFDIPYRTALTKATGLLKSPYKIWTVLDVYEQQKLFYFIFNEKLAYSKKTGYRTDKLPCAVTLFEEFVTTNSQDVEINE